MRVSEGTRRPTSALARIRRGFAVPKQCEGVPDKVLNPVNTWDDQFAYQDKYLQLASLFIENFKKFREGCAPDVVAAGPVKKDFVAAR